MPGKDVPRTDAEDLRRMRSILPHEEDGGGAGTPQRSEGRLSFKPIVLSLWLSKGRRQGGFCEIK